MAEKINMAEVLSLVSAPPEAIDPDLLERAEELLARVKSGETLALATVEVQRGRIVQTGWSDNGYYHELNSGAARLANRLASIPPDEL